ncbi:MAG: patatin-like phospholipase family protein [Xanthobacteraceae bacterium]
MVACAQIHNDPINQPLVGGLQQSTELGGQVETYYDDTVVALSFSGGGTRAAAFSYGVLTALDETPLPGHSTSLLDRVDFVTGVSGGSILAAYYGLKKRKALTDFKQRFLLRNAEANLKMDLSLLNIAKGLQGGINEPTVFPRWLDDNLYEHATFKSLLTQRRPYVWIKASDIYNRTPFVFGPVLFRALCSDITTYPISMAVAASAAVPVVFAPVVIEGYAGRCPIPLPAWVERVRRNQDAPPLLKFFADAMYRYHSGEVRYVKLLDGGMVDNYGLAGFTIARLASDTPYGPLEPEEAVKLRRLLFLVADAGRAPAGDWVKTVEGPSGANLITASSDTATGSGAVGSYSAFQDTMAQWQQSLINWRCKLSAAERRRYGAPAGWNCRDVKIFVGRVAFDQFDEARAAKLNAVVTAFKLPPDQVEMLIAAGHDAVKGSNVFNAFLNSMGAPRARARGRPLVSSAPGPQQALAQ